MHIVGNMEYILIITVQFKQRLVYIRVIRITIDLLKKHRVMLNSSH